MSTQFHILIVEDDEATCYVTGRLVQQCGHRVSTAETGLQALDVHDTDPADLIVLDMRLPDLHGRDIALDIRSRRPVPILALTNFPGDVAHVDVTLVKPPDPERLCQAIDRLIEADRVARKQAG